jgi:methyl-accepting chemotaxis protein
MKKTISIRSKMLIIFVVLVTIVIAGGIVSYVNLSKVEGAIDFISDTVILLNENVSQMKYLIMFTQRDILEAASFRDQDKLLLATSRSMAFHSVYAETMSLISDNASVASLDRLGGAQQVSSIRDQYRILYAKLIAIGAIFAEQRIDEATRRLAEIDELTADLNAKLDSVSDLAMEVLLQNVADVRSQSDVVRIMNILLVAFTLVGLVFNIQIGRQIMNNLKSMLEISDAIADGDLNRTFGIASQDEFGHLALNFEKAIEQLRGIANDIKSSSNDAQGVRETLSGNVSETSDALAQIAMNIESVNGHASNLDRHVEDSSEATAKIGVSAEQLSGSILQQASAIEESASATEEMIQSIQNVARLSVGRREASEVLLSATEDGIERMNETNARITGITSKVGDVRQAADVIKAIAGQTNLLSINAAIEAAHAGKSGKGFAVVAEEIRKLAQTSAENANAIGKSLESTIRDIGSLSEESESTSRAFETIKTEVNAVVAALTEISDTMDEFSVGTRETLKSITETREMTEVVKGAASEMSSSTVVISDSMGSVHSSSKEMHGATSEILGSVTHVNSLMDSLSQSVEATIQNLERMTTGVERFKT